MAQILLFCSTKNLYSADEREALAKLSEMQQSIAQAMAAFHREQVNAAMQGLAGSMDSAKAMQPLAADCVRKTGTFPFRGEENHSGVHSAFWCDLVGDIQAGLS